MSLKVSINSKVVDGVLSMNRKKISEAIKEFNGKDITITIARKRKERSDNQNNYYWGVIIPLIKQGFKTEWGDRRSKEEIHEFLKHEFNYNEHVNEDTGEIIKVGRSTTENTTTQQEEYHQDCRTFAKEWFGIEIPLPNEQMEFKID